MSTTATTSAESSIIFHNMHFTQDPQVETTNRATYHQKPASAAVWCRRGASRWFAARRTPLTQLTRRTRFLLEASTKPVRDSQACSSKSTQQGSSGIWIVSGATQNFDTYVYLTHHHHQCLSAAAWDDPRHVLFTPCQHR